jgi:hypothetical protein
MTELHHSRITEELYQKLTNEEDARACRDISDEACRVTPGNFLLLLSTHVLTKLGDAIASPKTVLAWLSSALGAPPVVLGMLVPIRESGSLIPQLFIGGVIRRLPLRKWVWVAGAVMQGAAVAGIGVVALTLRGAAAGWGLLALLTLFSLARGLCSVASKDVLGKTVPKGRRGQLTGWSASFAGVITVGLGAVLLVPGLVTSDTSLLGLALLAAGGLWLCAAGVYSLVVEQPGETSGGRNALREALASLSLLVDDRPFRRFVVARMLLMCSALSAPYYVALAQERIGSPAWLLGAFVMASGLANLVSAPVWGRLADATSRGVMCMAGGITAATGLGLALAAWLIPGVVTSVWLVPVCYFVLSIAHSGVRVGRKTYVVDLAKGNRRTDYVAVSNSVIGVALLLVGALGALAGIVGTAGMIALLALMGLLGALLSGALEPA